MVQFNRHFCGFKTVTFQIVVYLETGIPTMPSANT